MNTPLALCIMYAGLIFGASSVPGDKLPSLHAPDYVLHGIEYAFFGALLAWYVVKERGAALSRALWSAVLIGSLYGLMDEVHQHFVSNRIADPRDWVADTIGAMAGATVFLIIWMYAVSREGSRQG